MIQSITPILNVSDISASFRWFEIFGWKRGFAWNSGGMIACGATENEHGPASFGSIRCERVEIFLCVGGQGSQGTIMPEFPGDDQTDGVWMSWWVATPADVDRLHQLAVDHQAIVTYPPTDEPWGVREFHLRHPDGHMFRISSGIS